MSAPLQMSDYLAGLGARLARLAEARDVVVEAPTIDDRLAAEVLELAGTVAHASERKFAPLASFMAGVVVGRLRAAGAVSSDSETAAFIAQLREELDART